MPVIDFSPTIFSNALQASYFVGWVVYSIISGMEMTSYAIYHITADPTDLFFWTTSFGFYGSLVVCAFPWMTVVVYMLSEPRWVYVEGLCVYNLVGGIFIWLVVGLIHLLMTERFEKWAKATMKVN